MGQCCGKKEKYGEAGAEKAGRFGLGKRKRSDEGGPVQHISGKEELTNQLKAAEDKLVVVDFYATWCGPCKAIKPKVDELAEKMKADNVIFLKIDVDESEDLTAEYGISSMPTFVLIKSSQKVDEMSGVNLDRLKELIENNKGGAKENVKTNADAESSK